jgi:hypothetical protein
MRLAVTLRLTGTVVGAYPHVAGWRRPNPLNEIRRRTASDGNAQQDGSYIAALGQDHGTHLVDQVSPK